MNKTYKQLPGKVVEAGTRFEHVMAIALDPRTNYTEGIVRCILSREGDITATGSIDRSALHKVRANSSGGFVIGDKIHFKNQDKILSEITRDGSDFLGPEDPDIWIDEKNNLMHVYFTVPFKRPEGEQYVIILGHAVGADLDSLEMTEMTLVDRGDGGAKEVSIAPVNSEGVRLNLIESSAKGKEWVYSTVRVAVAEDMGKPWKFGETIFNPEYTKFAWIGGHASPGPLLPKTFIDIGENKMLGILNGCEANQKLGHKTKYGTFSVGLFVYDYEHGNIDWVSPEPLITDTDAKRITFASQFVETGGGKGILYAHVDDSFIRAYELNAEGLGELLPENF